MHPDHSTTKNSSIDLYHARGFNRRYYRGLKEFWGDFSYLISHRSHIRDAVGANGLPLDFRERLMLTVTEVNQCRYCRTFHVQQAELAGLTGSEIKAYLDGAVPREVPEDQRLAVSYARFWAETAANPPQEIRDQVRNEYEENLFQSIEITLRMIWMGNLLGNSFDFLLFRISSGRWGGVKESWGSDNPRLEGEQR
jgi:AhpD family alkylhydroperoxidase